MAEGWQVMPEKGYWVWAVAKMGQGVEETRICLKEPSWGLHRRAVDRSSAAGSRLPSWTSLPGCRNLPRSRSWSGLCWPE